MRALLVALIALAGCSARVVPTCNMGSSAVPGYPDMSYDFTNCPGAWSPGDVGLGTYVFISEWENEFGVDDRMSHAVSHLNLECKPEDWMSEYWDFQVSGLTSPYTTFVALRSEKYGYCRSLPSSSYLHELIHTALDAIYHNGDADHDRGTAYGDTWKPEHTSWLKRIEDRLADLLDIEPTELNVEPVDGRCFDTCDLE